MAKKICVATRPFFNNFTPFIKDEKHFFKLYEPALDFLKKGLRCNQKQKNDTRLYDQILLQFGG